MSKSRFASLIGQVGLAAESATEAAIDNQVGKRSDPSYRQISTYVRKDLYKSVRRELMSDERDFSDLLNELLSAWMTSRVGR